MNGYGSHTYSLWNAGGERFWVKFHVKTKQGNKTFADAEALKMTADDPDFSARDLLMAIKSGDFSKWTVSIQVMPETDADTCKWNPFDLTKVWPHGDYPLIEVGEMELNCAPENYFAEGDNGGGSVDYEPNSFGGPVEDKSIMEPPLRIDGNGARYTSYPGDDADLYGQPRAFWEKVLDDTGRAHLVANIVGSMSEPTSGMTDDAKRMGFSSGC